MNRRYLVPTWLLWAIAIAAFTVLLFLPPVQTP